MLSRILLPFRARKASKVVSGVVFLHLNTWMCGVNNIEHKNTCRNYYACERVGESCLLQRTSRESSPLDGAPVPRGASRRDGAAGGWRAPKAGEAHL